MSFGISRAYCFFLLHEEDSEVIPLVTNKLGMGEDRERKQLVLEAVSLPQSERGLEEYYLKVGLGKGCQESWLFLRYTGWLH